MSLSFSKQPFDISLSYVIYISCVGNTPSYRCSDVRVRFMLIFLGIFLEAVHSGGLEDRLETWDEYW